MNHIKHVAIIMDGNGRWGIKHKKSRNLGHKEGLKTVEKIIKSNILAFALPVLKDDNSLENKSIVFIILSL